MFATAIGASLFGRNSGTTGIDNAFAERHQDGIGAEIMGAGKFGPPGWSTDPTWRGWWGPNPPFHTPVYVATHHEAPPMTMEGGTTFHFVSGTPADILSHARAVAGDGDIRLGGGPSIVRQFLEADLVDEMRVVQVPIVLGRGVRLWDNLEGLDGRFDTETVSSPSGVTHLSFRRC
jgi:dihydrofolate reductase